MITPLLRLLSLLVLICALPVALSACEGHDRDGHHENGYEEHHEGQDHHDDHMGQSDDDDAYEVISEFWRIQDGGDYTRAVDLFAEDAVLVDPLYGTFEGKQAISEFMAMMNEEMGGQNISFRLVELAADGEVAWAQWTADTPRGERTGVGVYRVEDGKMTYYRDYMNPIEEPQEEPAPDVTDEEPADEEPAE